MEIIGFIGFADFICNHFTQLLFFFICPIHGSMNGGTIRETALSMDGSARP